MLNDKCSTLSIGKYNFHSTYTLKYVSRIFQLQQVFEYACGLLIFGPGIHLPRTSWRAEVIHNLYLTLFALYFDYTDNFRLLLQRGCNFLHINTEKNGQNYPRLEKFTEWRLKKNYSLSFEEM